MYVYLYLHGVGSFFFFVGVGSKKKKFFSSFNLVMLNLFKKKLLKVMYCYSQINPLQIILWFVMRMLTNALWWLSCYYVIKIFEQLFQIFKLKRKEKSINLFKMYAYRIGQTKSLFWLTKICPAIFQKSN